MPNDFSVCRLRGWNRATVYVYDNGPFFSVSGVQRADEDEMKLMASAPHRSHIYSVADFNMIKNVQKELISQVCAGVDDQLSSIVSGEEGELG